jgi:hypothetical protein
MEPEGSLPCSQSLPLDSILSQLNPLCPIDPYLSKVRLNVILPPTPSYFVYISLFLQTKA